MIIIWNDPVYHMKHFCPSSYFLPYLVNTLVFLVLKLQHDRLDNFTVHGSMYLFVFVETCIASNRLCGQFLIISFLLQTSQLSAHCVSLVELWFF